MTLHEFKDIPLTPEYATAVLRWAAMHEQPESDAAERAIRKIRELTPDKQGQIAADKIHQILDDHVPLPGTIVSCWYQPSAASSTPKFHDYWVLEGAIHKANEPGAVCAWSPGIYFHDLRIQAPDGVILWFHAFCPQRMVLTSPERYKRILAEINEHLDVTAPGHNSPVRSEENESLER